MSPPAPGGPSGGDNLLRLFVAVELPALLQAGLGRLLQELKRELPGEDLRWVRPEGIHLTMKFLGVVNRTRLLEISGALTRGLVSIQRFELQPEGVGSFGQRVVWVGIAGRTDALGELAAAVDRCLVSIGFPGEPRPFRGHLTVARVRDRTPGRLRRPLVERLKSFRAPRLPALPVNEVSLMSSSLQPGGARYTSLHRVGLA